RFLEKPVQKFDLFLAVALQNALSLELADFLIYRSRRALQDMCDVLVAEPVDLRLDDEAFVGVRPWIAVVRYTGFARGFEAERGHAANLALHGAPHSIRNRYASSILS